MRLRASVDTGPDLRKPLTRRFVDTPHRRFTKGLLVCRHAQPRVAAERPYRPGRAPLRWFLAREAEGSDPGASPHPGTAATRPPSSTAQAGPLTAPSSVVLPAEAAILGTHATAGAGPSGRCAGPGNPGPGLV